MSDATNENNEFFDIIKFVIDNIIYLFFVSILATILSVFYHTNITKNTFEVKVAFSSIDAYETSKYQIINNEYRKTVHANTWGYEGVDDLINTEGYEEVEDLINNETLLISFLSEFNSKDILVDNFKLFFMDQNDISDVEAKAMAIEAANNFDAISGNDFNVIRFEAIDSNINSYSKVLINSVRDIEIHIYDMLLSEMQEQIKNSILNLELSSRRIDAKAKLREYEIIGQQKLKLQFLKTQLKIAKNFKASDDFEFPSVNMGGLNEGGNIESISNFSLISLYFLKGTEAILSEIEDLEKKINSGNIILDEEYNKIMAQKKSVEIDLHPHLTLGESILNFKKEKFKAINIYELYEKKLVSMPLILNIIIFNVLGFIIFTFFQLIRRTYFVK